MKCSVTECGAARKGSVKACRAPKLCSSFGLVFRGRAEARIPRAGPMVGLVVHGFPVARTAGCFFFSGRNCEDTPSGSRVVQTHGECQLAIHIRTALGAWPGLEGLKLRLDLRVLPAAGLMWQAERRGQGNPTVCKAPAFIQSERTLPVWQGALSQLARKELLWL